MAVIFDLIIFPLFLTVAYLLFWPVPVRPKSWQAPDNPGYTGPFAVNNILSKIEHLPIGAHSGPESIAIDQTGRIYASTESGWIIRCDPSGQDPVEWVNTGGRPLGMAFDKTGNLIVADAYKGLLSISAERKLTLLTDRSDGIRIRYANDLDIAADGRIYFSDSSTKFAAIEFGGTYKASLLDIMEHGGHGRLLVYDHRTKETVTLLKGLDYANGVALSADGAYLLVNETGSYRTLRYWLTGPRAGESEIFISGLAGFPDNINRGLGGLFWIALVSPRNPLLDKLSGKPFLRTIVQRMPASIRPKAVPYSHIIAVDSNGKVVKSLQDPSGSYPMISSVIETERYLYLGSLKAGTIGRLLKDRYFI